MFDSIKIDPGAVISFAAMFDSIKIDPGAGPCFGVERAIDIAEKELAQTDTLYSMGDIVHNGEEMLRLEFRYCFK